MGYLPRRVVYNFQALPEAWLNGSGDVHHSFANPCLLIAINTKNQSYVLMRMSVRNVVLVGG